jgi:hypothetical protein
MYFKKFKEDSMQIPSQRSLIPSFCPDAHQCPKVSNCPLVASIQKSQQHVQTLISVWQEIGFPSQTQIWEDSCIRSDVRSTSFRMLSLIRQDVEKNCTHPDIRATPFGCQSLLWKLHAVKVQLSGRQDNTVQMLGQHRLDTALIWYCVKRVMESRLHSCPSRRRLEKSVSDVF